MGGQSLFGGSARSLPHHGSARVLVTVKAAPNPSSQYGETVCVAGLRIDDDGSTSWIRLYPIPFRSLEQDQAFRKYDVARVDVTPIGAQGGDNRSESHRPNLLTMQVTSHLRAWDQRAPWLEPMVTGDACRLAREARADSTAQSLALVRPLEVLNLELQHHPGWTAEDQSKIDKYVNQLLLFGDEIRTPLEAPRYKGWYRYRCHASACPTHQQQLLDWEFVALQRRHLQDGDAATHVALRARFLEQMCSPQRWPAFYLGNQAKRRHAFSVLGCYWPPQR